MTLEEVHNHKEALRKDWATIPNHSPELLVREYLRLREMRPSIDMEPKAHKRFQEVKKMLDKELERFTAQDVAELPFGSEEDILP